MKDWKWFKEFVKKMRLQQDELMKEQGGGNQIMLSISLVAYDLRDWIDVVPHGINLKTGKALASVNGVYKNIDVKHLFLTQNLGDSSPSA